MAHTQPSCGDNFHRLQNTVTRLPAAAYTTPAVGDLVALDTAADNTVVILSGIVAVYAIVEDVGPSATSPLSVTELVPGCQIELPYTGTVNRGDKVVFSSATQDAVLGRTKVKTDNSNGTGFVLAVDAGTPHGTGYAVVRF